MTSDDLQKTAKDTVDTASGAAADPGESAGRFASDAAEKGGAAASAAAGSAQQIYDTVRETVAGLGDHLPGSAGDTLQAGRRAYARGSDQIGRQLARQPIEALLLAGAIGYLVGWAANRR